MKKIKSILSLILAVAMLFSVICVFAEDETDATQEAATEASSEATSQQTETKIAPGSTFSDVPAGSKVEQAVMKLVTYGILSGYPDGTFKPDGQITRAEFAAVIARFNNLSEGLGTDVVTGFSDLDSDDSAAWARPYVKAAVDAKIINGFEDGTYRAAEPVTYEQAIKMIICAIDYEVIADSELAKLKASNPDSVTWSSGYIAAANKNSITVNAMTGDITAPATRGTVSILVSNALSAPKLTQVKDKDGNISYKQEGTIADDRYDKQEELDTVVVGTYYTSLVNSAEDIGESELLLKTSEGNKKYELSDALRNTVNLEDILGKKLTVYYDKNGIVTNYVQKNNTVTKVNQGDITSISDGEIKYEDSNGKTKTLSIAGAKIVYNGKYVNINPSDLSETSKSGYALKNGFAELIDNSNGKVLKITSFDVYAVNSFDKTNEKIYFKYNQTYDNGSGEEKFYQFPSKNADKPEIYVSGKKTEYENLSLSAYDVINLQESPKSAPGNIIKKMYITKAGSGKSIKVTAKEDDDEVESGEEIYKIAYNYLNYEYDSTVSGSEQKAPFERDETYTCYLDYTGQIAAVKYSVTDNTSYKYGYVLFAGEDKKTKQQVVRLFTQDGEDKTVALKSSLKFDGEKVKDTEVEGLLKQTAKEANKVENGSTEAEKIKNNSNEYNQPVRYSLSGDGSVDIIDTIAGKTSAVESPTDNLAYDYKIGGNVEGRTIVSSSTQLKANGKSYNVNSGTIVLYIPNDRSDYNNYSKLTTGSAFSVASSYETNAEDKKGMYIEALGIDNTKEIKTAKLLLIYDKNPTLRFIPGSSYMIVTKKVNGENLMYEGYKNGAKTTAKLEVDEDDYMEEDVPGAANLVKAEDVGVGDLIRYITKSDGKVIAVDLLFDADNYKAKQGISLKEEDFATGSENVYKNGRSYAFTISSSRKFYYFGTALDMNRDEKIISHSIFIDEDSSLKEEYEQDIIKKRKYGSAPVYEYNGSEVKLLENTDSIYSRSDGAATKLWMVTSSYDDLANANALYVIND